MGSSGSFGQAQTRLSVLGRSTSATPQTSNIGFVLQIHNNGGAPVDLSQLELRYWFSPGPLASTGTVTQQVNVDYAAVGAANIKSQIAPTGQAGIDALHLQFVDTAGSINPYSSSGDINVRVHKSDWSLYDQNGNFSFRPDTTLTNWDHVGLYRAGVLVWGSSPQDAGGTGT